VLFLLLCAWPCHAQGAEKVYTLASEATRIDVNELRYLIEPASLPLDISRINQIGSWTWIEKQRRFSWREISSKRLVLSFTMKTEVETVYFNYMWAPPLSFQKFYILEEDGHLIEPEVVRSSMLMVQARLKPGLYRVFFVAEPTILSDMKSNLYIMNSAYLSGTFLDEAKFYLYVYGVGSAFVFFNFTMFLLHKRRYFIYYVGYSLTILYILAVGSGDLHLTLGPFWNLSLCLNCMFTILMSSSVLRLREFHPRLLQVTYALWAVSCLFLMGQNLANMTMFNALGLLTGLLCYFLCMYAAVRRMLVGYIPATFFALGWGVLGIGYVMNVIAIYVASMRGLIYSAYVAYAIESMLFAVALAYRTRDSEQKANADKLHALSQLQKVVYPHQIEQIKQGAELEATMPTSPSHGCVLAFDIVGSSKIKHIKAKEFFRNFFARCNAIMSEGYDGKNLKARAYRIKEIGDGGLCSIGYPFASLTGNPANEAVDIGKRIAQALAEEAEMLHSPTPITCGIGIALDTLIGFYPDTGTKEYDIYGHALVLATRYEAMRKTLFEDAKDQSILIIQEQVYLSLDPSHREGFLPLDLEEKGIVVRDDPAAKKLYYQFLKVAVDQKETPHLAAV
jgi:class 3 adenylate cyclase